MKTKNYRTLTKVVVLLALLMTLSSSSFAGDKIKIRLHQPPPNKLGVGDLWNLELDNTSGQEMKIYLTGTATEEKDGLIVDGKSKPFVIKPGKTSYSYKDFSNAEVKYSNGKYKEIMLRTGNAPEGNYTICVTAFDEGGEVAGLENCIMQAVKQQGSINLISPEDGKELDPDTLPGLVFTWTPLAGDNGPYSLRIVELKGSQSPDEAIKESRPILDKEGIKGTSYQYSLADAKLEKGKRYAWMVYSGSTSSEVWVLSMMGTCTSLQVDSIKIRCTDNPKVFSYQFYTKNVCSGIVKWTGLTINPLIPGATISTTPSAPQNINGLAQLLITGNLTFTSAIPGSVCLRLESTSPSGSGYSRIDTCLSLPNCSKNCCENFTRKVTGISVTPTSSPGAYRYSATLTAGPNKIKKVVATLAYLQWISSNENCKKCVSSSQNWGNINSVPSPTITGFSTVQFTPSGSVSTYSHEVTWSGGNVNMSAGVPLNMYLVFPQQSTLSCCQDTINFCIKFEFTDTTCMTCDTLVCFRYIRNTATNPLIRMDEIRNLRNMEFELEKEQPIENEDEYKKGKEEQDDLMKKTRKDGEGQAMSSVIRRNKKGHHTKTEKGAK